MRTPTPLLVLSLASWLTACGTPSGDTSGEGGSSSTETTSAMGGDGGASTGGASTGGDAAGGNGNGGSSTGGASTGGSSTGGASTGGGGDGWGPEQCPSPPDGVTVGIEIGQQLPDLTVMDCDGNEYSLSELCGADGLWLFAAHGWCPLCQNVSTNAEAIHDSFAGMGLASAIVVVETGASQPPSATYCNVWRDQFGLQDVVTLYDPTGAILDVWPGPSSSLSAFMNADRVITAKLYHDGNVDTIKAKITEALNQ
jgi:hypothetical protein